MCTRTFVTIQAPEVEVLLLDVSSVASVIVASVASVASMASMARH